MSRRRTLSTPPLPSAWPCRVRSAVVHAVAMARVSLSAVRSGAEHHFDARVRLRSENDRLLQEIALLREEIRIKDARMERLPAQRRPHYPPIERLAILELRAARGWSKAETARRMLVTPLTVDSWNKRLDDEGLDALVQIREPVNRFPELVGYVVRRLRALCPSMGSRRIARVLARAGLHLGATTVRRMLAPKPKPAAPRTTSTAPRAVTANRPNHVWHTDLTPVPITFGLWVPWSPFASSLSWPFSWWVAVVIDHYSRRVMGVKVFFQEPSAESIARWLRGVCRKAGVRPAHLITDHGPQFTAAAFAACCRRLGIRQRFGAVGKYGSIAVVERFIRSMKNECTRAILVPFRRREFEAELAAYVGWFNAERPHSFLRGATPDEVYFGKMPANRRPRFEPRERWPRRSPCAKPQALVQGQPGVDVELVVERHDGRRHLPVVGLKRVA